MAIKWKKTTTVLFYENIYVLLVFCFSMLLTCNFVSALFRSLTGTK